MSDKERSTVICHRCRWGAAPGHLTQCRCPDITPGRGKQGYSGVTGVNAIKWALPSVAAATGDCSYFAPVEVAG